MTAVIVSQWLKLRRLGMLGALGAGVAVIVLGAVLTVMAAGSDRGEGPGASSEGITVAELTSSDGLTEALGRLSTLLGVIVLAVAASATASEYVYGTMRNLLVWEPRRVRLVVANWVALTIAVAAAVVLACGVAALAATVAAAQQGHATAAWWTAAGVGNLGAGVANLVLAAAGWSLLGTLLGLVLRSPAAAIGVGVAYALPFETILAGVVDGLDRWLPGQLLAAVADGGNSTVSYAAALGTLAVYGLVAAILVLRAFRDQDVVT